MGRRLDSLVKVRAVPTLMGILAQSAIVLAVTAMVWNTGIAYYCAFVGCLVLAFLGVGLWKEPAMPKTPQGWALCALLAPLVGGAIFCVEMGVGKLFHPELDFFHAGLHTGPLGGGFTIAGTLAMVVISVGGIARCVALNIYGR